MIVFPPAFVVQEQALQIQAFKAIYSWGYASPTGEGKGTLAVLVNTSNDKVIIELHTLGERLLLLDGDNNQGYRLRIPRENIDKHATSLGDLPIPFLPEINDVVGLARLLTQGIAPGIKARHKDKNGPKRLRWDGKDNQNEPCTVWLKRTLFERL